MQNKKEPKSLWSGFFPRTPMRWEWDDEGDSRVAELWHLREELARSSKVVYAKWYRNRATFFSPECFRWARRVLSAQPGYLSVSSEAKRCLEIIGDNSPLSTKELKKQAKSDYAITGTAVEKAMSELWKRLLIVGYGEVDDGAFPSLAVGAADQMFESWCEQSEKMDTARARSELQKTLSANNLFLAELDKVTQSMQGLQRANKGARGTPKAKTVNRSEKAKPSAKILRYEDLVGN